MAKRPIVIVRSSPLLKSHVEGYSRKDGSYVKPHEDKRTKKAEAAPAGKKASTHEEAYSHPHAVGKAEISDPYAEGAHDASGIKFAGTQYYSTGKSGKSFHDETPVREFESDDGHRVWMDNHSRVHADDVSEVPKLRKKFEAHSSQGEADEPIADKDRFNAGEGDPVHAEQSKADKTAILEAALGKHNASMGYISIPPATNDKVKAKMEELAAKVQPLGFKISDEVKLNANGNGTLVLSNEAGERVAISAQDAGDRHRISVQLLGAAKGGDKPAGGAKGGDSGDGPSSHAQKQQDADDAAYSGEAEKEDYGVYHKPGSKVKDPKGEEHEVAKHRGPVVTTKGGKEFHPSKLSPVDGGKGGLPSSWKDAHDHAEETSEAAWNGEGGDSRHADAAAALEHSAKLHKQAAQAATDDGDEEAAKHHTDKADGHLKKAAGHKKEVDPWGDGEGLGGGPAKGHRARAKKADAEGKAFAGLKSHPMHSESDLAYFKGKGYSAKEIKEIWDRDHAAGHKPVVHKKAPDSVGLAADPDHFKKKGQGSLFKSIRESAALLIFGRTNA